ncbi:MAG: cupin domain-containing protein [Bacteroidetes bacterium]|nr:cupin domain-containing protein [Bacteroidota bacterium]
MQPLKKVNLAEKFDLFHETWSPKIVAELNGQQVKLAKVEGEFEWHHHEDKDELFLVVKGQLTIGLRDLTASGFWSSRIGVNDLGYSGNTARASWDGCPQDALEHLGLS